MATVALSWCPYSWLRKSAPSALYSAAIARAGVRVGAVVPDSRGMLWNLELSQAEMSRELSDDDVGVVLILGDGALGSGARQPLQLFGGTHDLAGPIVPSAP